MPDLMQFLRMRNLFGQPPMIGNDLPEQGGITGNMFGPRTDDYGNTTISPQIDTTRVSPAVAEDPSSGYDVGQRMSELYTPEHAATDRFNEMIGDYPKRTDYHPSMLRKIGASLTALGGQFGGPKGRFAWNPNAMAFGEQVLNRPYNEKITDWKNQIGPAQTAANMERAQNINERTLAYQTVSNELKQQAEEHRVAKNEREALIREHRANVYDFKSKNPGMKFLFPKGGNVRAVNPVTGEEKDTGIPTGSMTELDKMNLTQEFTRENIGSKGAEAANVAGINAKSRETVAETRGWKPYEETLPDGTKRTFMYNEITGETRDRTPGGRPNATPVRSGAGGSARPETASQTRVRQFNAARELYNTKPELRQFIKLGSPGSSDFTITPPGKGFFGGDTGPNAIQYKQIQDAIYGGNANAPVSAHTPVNNPNLGTEPPARTPTGTTPTPGGNAGQEKRVKVADMTGKVIGTIPAADAAKLDTKKYKVVQ